MRPWTLEQVAIAVRASWSAETCDPVDVPDWSHKNKARGQCGSTALVVNDLLGGDLMLADVRRADGSRQGVHYWNRLPDGSEVDLTRAQFVDGEFVQDGQAMARPSGPPQRCGQQYEVLRERVLARLRDSAPDTAHLVGEAGRKASIEDPDGNSLAIIEARPRAGPRP